MTEINRRNAATVLTIASSGNLSDALAFQGNAGGIVLMPAAWTAASIGFKICDTIDGTYLPLYDDEGTLVQIASPAVDCAYSIPPELFGAAYVKLWSQDGSASSTNQAAERSLIVLLKS